MDQNPFMMAGGMPPQGMQRPQPGNENDQIHAKIMDELRKIAIPSGGWQMTMDFRERANWVMQMYVERMNLAGRVATGTLSLWPRMC